MHLFALLIALSSAGWQQTTVNLDRYVAEAARLGRFNGVVLVAHGRDVHRAAFGFANVERRVPNTVRTQFEIASLSKMFTAFAILKLRDEGRLKLDDSICKYLASCPAAWQVVTIDEVLHHRSGLPDYEDALEIESPAYYAFMTPPDSSKRILEREAALPLDFTPGSKFSYSNTGYIALGFIVESAAHLPYATYLRMHIFRPAVMNDTGVIGVDPAPRMATGYAAPDVGWPQRLAGFRLEDVHPKPVPVLPLTAPHGDGGLFSTVDDLLKWARVMQGANPALVSAAERAEIFRAVDGYGDGWMVGTAFGVTRYRHTGELPGFLSNIAIYPTEDTTVISWTNVGMPMRTFTWDISAIALGKPYDPPFSGTMISLTPEQDAALFGAYRLTSGDIMCVSRDRDMLAATVKGQYVAGLLPVASDRFYMPLSGGYVQFSGSEVNLRYSGVDHRGERYSDVCPAGTK